MLIAAWAVAGLLLVTSIGLGLTVARLWVRTQELEAEVHAVQLSSDPTVGSHAVVINVRNHDDVAASRNPLARAVSAVSPGLIRGIVHREVVRQTREQLREEGVDADVALRRVLPAPPEATPDPAPQDPPTQDPRRQDPPPQDHPPTS